MPTSSEIARRIRSCLIGNPDVKSVAIEQKGGGVAIWVLGGKHTVAVHVADCKEVLEPTRSDYQQLDAAIVEAIRLGAFKRVEIYREVESLLLDRWRGGRKYFMKVLDDRLAALKRRGVIRSSRQGYGWVLHGIQVITQETTQ